MLLFWLVLLGINGYFAYLNAARKNPLAILSVMVSMLCIYEVIMCLKG